MTDTVDASSIEENILKPKYYMPGQVCIASFFGGPAAGFWLLARNYQAFGEEEMARRTVKVGATAMGVVVIAMLYLPALQAISPPLIYLSYMFAFYQFTQRRQIPKIAIMHEEGCKMHSHWRLPVIAVLSLALTFGVIGVVAFVLFFLGVPVPESIAH